MSCTDYDRLLTLHGVYGMQGQKISCDILGFINSKSQGFFWSGGVCAEQDFVSPIYRNVNTNKIYQRTSF